MQTNQLRIGQDVVLADGNVRARVLSNKPRILEHVDTGAFTPHASIELTRPYRSTTGKTLPAGFVTDVPVEELRELS